MNDIDMAWDMLRLYYKEIDRPDCIRAISMLSGLSNTPEYIKSLCDCISSAMQYAMDARDHRDAILLSNLSSMDTHSIK
jgi:hypothetical protein